MVKNIRVVLAISHKLLRAGLRYFLEKSPDIHVIEECDNNHESIDMALRICPDVLILEMSVNPEKQDIMHHIREKSSEIRVLALCDRNDDIYMTHILSSDINGCILKEEASHSIIEAVRGVAQEEDGWFSRRATAKFLSQKRSREQATALYRLSRRETEILHLIALGYDTQHLTESLSLSRGTIKNHISNIYLKIHVRTRAEAVTWVWKHGLLEYSEKEEVPNAYSYLETN
jgi:DNA-binding NarL/FixJ family response regulator